MKKSQLRTSLLAASALSISIASQLHAATLTSAGIGGGLWSDNTGAVWTPDPLFPLILVPNTYVGDTAILDFGDILDYDAGVTTPATPFSPAGGLAVAKGGKITIDNGSILGQSTLTNEIRIGDGGAGAGNGVGTLTIDHGGALKTQAALGLLIGSDLNNPASPTAGNGAGTVNIKEGSIIMGLGAAAGGVGVGVEGSTGFLNVGDGVGVAGDESSILDLKTNNVRMGIGATNQTPGASAGTGTVTVQKDGVIKQGSAGIFVGVTGGTGTLDIKADGKLLGQGTPAHANSVTTVGWVAGGDLSVGDGVGSLGSFLSAGVVTGVGHFIVGDNGADVVPTIPLPNLGAHISGGTFNAQETIVGRNGGKGFLEVTGGIYTTGEDRRDGASLGLRVGTGGTGSVGTVNITGGEMHQDGWMDFGLGAGNTGSLKISGTGKFFHEDAGANNDGNIGRDGGTGNLEITGGGTFVTNFWLNAARGGGSTGHIVVDGATSTFTQSAGRLNVGEQGTGTMVVKNGGTYAYTGGDEAGIVGQGGGSNGTLTIGEAGVSDGFYNAVQPYVPATPVDQRHGQQLIVGDAVGSEGTLSIERNSVVNVREITLNNGKGTVNQNGGTVNVARWLTIGAGDAGGAAGDDLGLNKATYTLNSGIINTPELIVGALRRGEMVVNGGTVNILNGSFTIGRWGAGWNGNGNAHGEGVVTQNSGTITVPAFTNLDVPVGNSDNAIGTLNVKGDGYFNMLSNEGAGVGDRNGARVILGNALNTQGTLNVGDNPSDTARFNVRYLTVGQNGKGTATQNGGTVNVGQWLKIGEGDSGGPAGDAGGLNKAIYTLNAGVINTPELMVGEGRRGEMVVNGGTVNILNGGFAIGRWGTGWNGNGNLHGEGTLTQNSGTITAPAGQNLDVPVGNTSNAIGTLTVKGDAHFAFLSNAGAGVGDRNGARVIVGNEVNSQGTLNIGDNVTDTLLFEVRHLTVGQNGKATVTQNGGTVQVGQWLKIGEGDSGGPAGDAGGLNKALYTLNDGVINTPELMIGEGRRGEMVVNGGTVNILNGGFGIGRWGPGWNGGANWHGEGALTQGGGRINANGQLTIADTAGAKGTYNLSAGTLNLGVGGNHSLVVGNGGLGTMNFTGGTVLGVDQLNVGNNGGSVGDITVDGPGTILNTAGESHIGNNGQGTLTVRNGAEVHFNGGWAAKVGTNNGSNGRVNVETGGKVIATNSWIVVGAETGSTGRMDISDTTNAGTLVDVSNAEGRFITARLGTAVVNQSGGAVKTGNWFALGLDPGSNGTYNFSGGTIDVSAGHNIDIANQGTGRMTITNGNAAGTTIVGGAGVVNYFNVGADTNSNGRLDIALANATDKIVSRELYAGNNAGSVGRIDVTSGILQTNETAQIGRNNVTATGTINIDGPTAVWNRGTGPGGSASDVQIGFNGGTGNLNVKNGGTVNHNWWLNVGRGATSTGHVTVDGTGSVLNIVDGFINVGEDGVGTMVVSNGGKVLAPNAGTIDFVLGRNGGSNGTLEVKTGGKVQAPNIRAGGGTASLTLRNNGILVAGQDEANFLRGFTGVGGHSKIQLEGSGGTIDSNGHRVKIAAGDSLFTSASDTNPTDGQAGAVLRIKGDDATLPQLTLTDTDKVTLQTQVGDGVNGYLSIRVLPGGWLDDEVGQVLDNLTIDSGGYYEVSALNSPPGAPALAEDGGFGGSAASSLASSPAQGVPEPGSISLLLLSALGMLGRRHRGKRAGGLMETNPPRSEYR